MATDLAQLLLSTGLVTAEALQEALQRQVVFGGSLDTNLLEIGTQSETDVLAALSQALGAPAVGREQIDQIGAHMSRLFPLVFAETYHLVPYRLVEQDFWVLLNSVPDPQLLERIAERLQLRPKPLVTTEVRLHYAMHQLYRTALLPRFVTLLQKLDNTLPKRAPSSSPSGGEHVLSWGLSSGHIAPARARGDRGRGGLDIKGLLARLESASDRDSIVEILLGAALAVFDYAALFSVQGGTVRGWRGTTTEATQRLVRLSLSVELPSVFQTIYATGGHYLGPLPQNSVNAQLLSDMGRVAPRAALLAPISVGGKIAAILWADNGATAVSSKRVAAVLLLAQRAGIGLEGLIRKRKATAQRLIDTQSGTLPAASVGGNAPVAAPGAPPLAAAQPVAAPDDESWLVDDAGIGLSPPPAVEPPLPSALPLQAALAGVAVSPATSGAEQWGTARLHDVARPPPDAGEVAAVELAAPTADATEDYKAFAEVTDSPEQALDDWEDVLVETAGIADGPAAAAAANRRRQAAPPSVSWDEVIAEAERAAHIVAARAAESVEVAGTLVDETELLFDSLDAQDTETRRAAIERLIGLGAAIDAELRERFPGRVTYNPLAPDARLLPFRRSSGLLELIGTRGASTASVVLPHLESTDAVKRFFAIYFLHAVSYPPALGALARRLYDPEPRNRYLAADALRTYSAEPGYSYIVQGLRDQLKVPILESQVATVQVLGQLRDPNAVPSLIPLVVASRPELGGAAASALAVICGQAFGQDVTQWAAWWQSHYNQPRPAWLVESLRHPSAVIAQLANNELALLSGRNVPFDPNGPPELRETTTRAWEAWWEQASGARQAARARAANPTTEDGSTLLIG